LRKQKNTFVFYLKYTYQKSNVRSVIITFYEKKFGYYKLIAHLCVIFIQSVQNTLRKKATELSFIAAQAQQTKKHYTLPFVAKSYLVK
jgi:hypothetical protein